MRSPLGAEYTLDTLHILGMVLAMEDLPPEWYLLGLWSLLRDFEWLRMWSLEPVCWFRPLLCR